MCPETDVRDADRAIAALAEVQHGVAARRQLVEMGLDPYAIRHRVRRGRLHPLHRGVYAVGHRRIARDGRWMAAVLACGPGAVLSHRSAAALWAILPSERATIDVTAPTVHAREGIEAHRSQIPADERTRVAGIPVTTVARTLLDLAAVETSDRLERALDEAERRRLGDSSSLSDLLQRYGPRRGSARLRKLTPDPTDTRSNLERDFLRFLDRHGIPRPQMNVLVLGHLVDAYWPATRLVAELDGFDTHSTRRAFHDDRERDRRLQAAGHHAIRITARQLDEATAADLRAMTRNAA